MRTWQFYVSDNDRSTGWTNHGFVLQLVCESEGETPAEAWELAKATGIVPEGLVEDPDVAIGAEDLVWGWAE